MEEDINSVRATYDFGLRFNTTNWRKQQHFVPIHYLDVVPTMVVRVQLELNYPSLCYLNPVAFINVVLVVVGMSWRKYKSLRYSGL